MEARPKPILFLLFLVALTLNVVSILTWDLTHIGNDGIQYFSTAKNWLAGNGFSTDALMYAPHFQGRFPAAQTVWPPGYPLVIAQFMKLGIDDHNSILALNHIAHALSSLVMWLLLQKMGIGRFFATVCTFAFYFMCMPWAYVSAGLTEPVFTTLLLSALLFLPDPKNSSLTSWILCGLIIAATIYIRFSTVFFAASTGAGIMLYLLLYEQDKPAALIKPCFKLALLVSLPVLAFGHLMYRTNTLIGTFDRYSGSKEPETLISTIKLWGVVAAQQLGFSSSDLISGKLVTVLFLLFILLAIVVVVWFLVTHSVAFRNSPSEKSVDHFRVVSFVAVLHMLILVAYLSYVSTTSSPLDIISRYTFQFYPGLYAVFCVMLHTLFNRYSSGHFHSLIKGLTVSLTALYLFAQINSVLVTRTQYFSQSKSTSQLMKLRVNDNTEFSDFIKACFDNNSQFKSIWSTHGQSIHLHTGIPALSHAAIYTKESFSAEKLAERTSGYNVGMFVFMSDPNFSNEQYSSYMSSVQEWITNEGFVKQQIPQAGFAKNWTTEIYVTPECQI